MADLTILGKDPFSAEEVWELAQFVEECFGTKLIFFEEIDVGASSIEHHLGVRSSGVIEMFELVDCPMGNAPGLHPDIPGATFLMVVKDVQETPNLEQVASTTFLKRLEDVLRVRLQVVAG